MTLTSFKEIFLLINALEKRKSKCFIIFSYSQRKKRLSLLDGSYLVGVDDLRSWAGMIISLNGLNSNASREVHTTWIAFFIDGNPFVAITPISWPFMKNINDLHLGYYGGNIKSYRCRRVSCYLLWYGLTLDIWQSRRPFSLILY